MEPRGDVNRREGARVNRRHGQIAVQKVAGDASVSSGAQPERNRPRPNGSGQRPRTNLPGVDPKRRHGTVPGGHDMTPTFQGEFLADQATRRVVVTAVTQGEFDRSRGPQK